MAKQSVNVPSLFSSWRFWGVFVTALLFTLGAEGYITNETVAIWSEFAKWVIGGATTVGILDRIGSQAK